MDIYKIIGELVEERNRIAKIIASLEEAAGTRGSTPTARKRRGRKSMDPKARTEVSERMRRYWAKRRAEQEATKKSA